MCATYDQPSQSAVDRTCEHEVTTFVSHDEVVQNYHLIFR
jgi:hypothetical protein